MPYQNMETGLAQTMGTQEHFVRIPNHVHARNLKNSQPRNYKCHTCLKTFTKKCNLQYHTNIHTGERPYKCGVCNQGFSAPGSLRTHKKLHVRKLSEKHH
ncbi:unnamed protein product [Owenia fusiformis]|uniref:C2H2-type domain-containing protein n=1 Tax=Owenia fusiformis TaxID=6347 RepID=A0A8S4N8T0_OWEFU|nr:unnamed protein product [Owenia fusiformis]